MLDADQEAFWEGLEWIKEESLCAIVSELRFDG